MVGDLRKQQVHNGGATAAGLKLPTQHIAARNPSQVLWFRKTTSIFLRSIFSATMSPRLPALWIIRSGAKFPSKNLGSNVFLYIYIYIYILHFWLSMQREVVHKSSGSRFFVRPISRPATAESIHYWMLLPLIIIIIIITD